MPEPRQAAPVRQQAMLQLLSDSGELNVTDLSARFDVSEMTVRRDLAQLASAGLLRRTRGGAGLAGAGSFEPPFALRARTNTEAKAKIAALAARQVQDGQTVLLDGGTTGLAVAQALLGRPITVCAFSLRVAEVLSAAAATRVMVPAGSIRTGEGSIAGPEVADALARYSFDLYLLTASAFDATHGFTEWNREDAAVKRAALGCARGTIAVCDSSKWASVAFANICPLDRVDVLVTDHDVPTEAREAVESAGVELLLP